MNQLTFHLKYWSRIHRTNQNENRRKFSIYLFNNLSLVYHLADFMSENQFCSSYLPPDTATECMDMLRVNSDNRNLLILSKIAMIYLIRLRYRNFITFLEPKNVRYLSVLVQKPCPNCSGNT